MYVAEKTLYLSETLDRDGEVVADCGAAGPVRHEAVGDVGHHARGCYSKNSDSNKASRGCCVAHRSSAARGDSTARPPGGQFSRDRDTRRYLADGAVGGAGERHPVLAAEGHHGVQAGPAPLQPAVRQNTRGAAVDL